MTTPDDPRGPVPDADPLDELASAIVDGEADGAEAARAGEPVVAARVDACRAVAELVATPVPPLPDDERERVLAGALAAAEARVDDNVVAMKGRRRRPPVWLPAAAAVAVAVAGFGLLVAALDSGTEGSDEAATADADATLEQAETFDDAAGGAGSGGESTAAAEAPAPAGASADRALDDLGELDGVDALEAQLTERSARFAPATTVTVAEEGEGESEDGGDATTGTGGSQASFGAPCADGFGTSLVAVFTARLDGRPVTVGLFEDPGEPYRYIVVDQASCEQVAAGEL